MTFSNSIENQVLNAVCGAVAYTPDVTYYVGLSTADPTDDASGNAEPSAGSYARVTITNNETTWGAAGSSSARANAITIDFPESTAAWEAGADLTHFAIWSHATNETSSDLVCTGALDTARAVAAAGVTLSFAVGALDVTLN